MKVIMINSTDSGGPGLSINRLRRELKKHYNIDTKFLVGKKMSPVCDEDVIQVPENKLAFVFQRGINSTMSRLSLPYFYNPFSSKLYKYINSFDIVSLHNTHGGYGYFPYPILPKLSQKIPIVWTLHDMWSFTGHCGYSYDCERWKTGCEKCPYLEIYPSLTFDTTAFHWKLKEKIYSKSNLTIVTPSKWLAKKVSKSPLMKNFIIEHINNGIDLDVYKPIDKDFARKSVGIPIDLHVLMISTASITKARKGREYLLNILNKLPTDLKKRVLLLVVGKGDISRLKNLNDKFKIHFTGYVSQEFFRFCLNASDILLLPTLADNLPTILIESIACGTPAVTFDVGGCGEIIRHLETGYLAKHQDTNDFVNGIITLLKNQNMYKEISNNCRRYAKEKFSVELMVKQYNRLFNEVINKD